MQPCQVREGCSPATEGRLWSGPRRIGWISRLGGQQRERPGAQERQASRRLEEWGFGIRKAPRDRVVLRGAVSCTHPHGAGQGSGALSIFGGNILLVVHSYSIIFLCNHFRFITKP